MTCFVNFHPNCLLLIFNCPFRRNQHNLLITVINLQNKGGSLALVIASVWTGIVHLALGVLGTFVLKRFPTSFSVGFLLGVLVVLANQNLILFATFSGYAYGSPKTNHSFASLGFTLFCVLAFMALLLVHFKHEVVVAPMDVKSKDGDDASYGYGEGEPETPVSRGTASP